MDNLSIENTLLRPQLSDGWDLNTRQTPPSLNNSNENQRFDINEIAVMILNHCDGIQSVASIIDTLMMQFPEAKQEIPEDVESVLRELHQKQVLTFTPAQSDELFSVPQKTTAHAKKKLCIGMATYDDYDGVYFSVQAIRLYHPEILDDIEIVVIDNHPDGPCAKSLKQLEHWLQNYRYIPCESIRGTAVRDFIFREANADYILCIDSHVMVQSGAIKQLLDYFDAHPDCKDFLQGPLLNDDLRNISTHFVPGWNEGMYGTWGMDSRGAEPDAEAFEIPMQGLGLFACAKEAWPGFNPRFSGFGGEEGYIHEKCRQGGGRTLCLPFLRWLHRFNRPMGTRYSVSWDDRIRNYLIGRDELKLDYDDVITHFNEHIGERNTQVISERVMAEIAHPFYYFDAIYCLIDEGDLQPWVSLQSVLEDFGISHRLTPIDISGFSDDPQIARMLAKRDILLQAQAGAYECIFVFDAQSMPNFLPDAAFSQALTALKKRPWSLFYPDIQIESPLNNATVLAGLEGLQAAIDNPLALHRQVFTQLLEVIPDDEEGARSWLDESGGLAAYYDQSITDRFALAAT